MKLYNHLEEYKQDKQIEELLDVADNLQLSIYAGYWICYGNEDKEASRRVEFKFSLRDADMISEMNDILQSDESMNGMPVFGVVTEE
mgnify:CR=1 FL=1